MNYKQIHTDYRTIEGYIHAARIERAVYLAEAITDGIQATARGLRRLGEFVDGRRFATTGRNVKAETDRRAIQAHSFLKRSVPRY